MVTHSGEEDIWFRIPSASRRWSEQHLPLYAEPCPPLDSRVRDPPELPRQSAQVMNLSECLNWMQDFAARGTRLLR